MKRILFLLVLLTSTLNAKWVSAYHPTWWFGVYTPSMIDWSSMTHIIIFPANDASATAPYFNNSAYVSNNAELQTLITTAHAHGVKVIFSVCGGYGQTNMPVVAADEVKCQTFVDSSCSFAYWNHADGIELDWEFPQASDVVGWNKLIRKCRGKLNAWPTPGIFTTSMFYSIGSSQPSGPYYRDSMQIAFDQINLMSYTMWMGSSAGPFYTGFDTPINQPTMFPSYYGWSLNSTVGGGPLTFVTAGYDTSKLGIGVSFEGTYFDGLTDTTNFGIGKSYGSWGFCSSVDVSLSGGYRSIPASTRYQDPTAMARWAKSGTSVYSYQDTTTVRAIGQWAKDHNWGGMIIYDVACGYNNTGTNKSALLKAAYAGINGAAIAATPSKHLLRRRRP